MHIGYAKIDGALELVDKYLGIDTFDLTVMFSDHGFLEFKSMREKSLLKFMSEDRTQIFMFLRFKGDDAFAKNNKLCTIMDVYPTICNFTNTKICKPIEGIDLVSTDEHNELFIEDHKTFNASLGQTIERWAVVNKKGLAAINCQKEWVASYDITEKEKENYVKQLLNKASCFEENTKMQMIRNYYDSCLISCLLYYDGKPRKAYPPLLERVKKPIRKLLQIILSSKKI